MLRWIVGTSLKGRFVVLALAGALVYFGSASLQHAPVDVFPEFAPPRVEVQTTSLGMSATEVENLVTVPMEQALNGVPGLDTIRSKSVTDLSSIEMIFKQGTDEMNARQLVQERLAQVAPSLPTWAAPPQMRPPLSATARTLQIGMTSKSRNLLDLSNIAYWTVRQKLLRVPGVANVAIWGERLDLQQVEADPQKMAAKNVTLDQVMQTTSDAVDTGLLQFAEGSSLGTGGFVDTPNQRLTVEHVPPIVNASDLSRVPIEGTEAHPVLLGDVANLVRDHQPLAGDGIIGDQPGLLLVVEKFPWGNTLDVTRGVEQALDEMKPGLTDITFDSNIFRPASFIQTAIDNLTEALVLGALLMVLMLGAFLWDWRSGLISVVAIPLALLAAALVLRHYGITINTMILAGFVIALGDIVDDAIVDVENVVRRLTEERLNPTGRSTARVILEASMEVRGAIVYATLIEVAAVAPVILLPGVSGAFFRPLATAYALAILASMAVALTVTPALCLLLLRRAPLTRRSSPLVNWLQPRYQRLLTRIIARRPMRPIFAAVALIAVAALILPFLGSSLFPEFKERDFLVHWISKPGTTLAEQERTTEDLSRTLSTVPGVRDFGSHIGQAFLAEEVVGVDQGEIWVSIDPKADYEQTHDQVQDVVQNTPGLWRDVETYLAERISEVLSGSPAPITVRIFGDDLTTLRAKADEVQNVLAGTPGVTEAKMELQQDQPQIEITENLQKSQRYGLKPGDVRRAAGVLVAGEEVGDIYSGGKTYDVQVWSTPQTRSSPSAISQMLIDTPSGQRVKVGDVADVRLTPTPSDIKHENTKRRIDVTASTNDKDLGKVIAALQPRLDGVQYPAGMHAELLGDYQERESAQNYILLLSIGALAAIFLLLQLSFRNTRLAALAFATLPMAMAGGVIAAALTGGILSLGALVGLFTVFGIAARNKIMLISHYRHLEHEEGMAFGLDLVLRGARERLRPILMTALSTGLAILPLVFAGDVPGDEIEHPMAVVILGGLITSTLLNLFVVPALYLRFGRSQDDDDPTPPPPPEAGDRELVYGGSR